MFLWVALATSAEAEMAVLDDFSDPSRWSYVSDRVMGGVSDGGAAMARDEGRVFAQLRGEVSTANNGGFIQIRRPVDGFPPNTTGLMLDVRGNGATYYVHLRTNASRRPWQYYAASFTAPESWSQIDLPLSSFTANGWGLTAELAPEDVTSVGIVAYGANYTAALDVARIVLR